MNTKKFFAFPSINQFKDVIKQVRKRSEYNNVPYPILTFNGTVKLHGTNAAIIYSPDGEIYAQSRERLIDPVQDNAGFASWVHSQREELQDLFKSLSGLVANGEYIQIYGEWCGGNIQKGVGISKLPKMFVVFGIRVSSDPSVNLSKDWENVGTALNHNTQYKVEQMYNIEDFKTYSISIDFSEPELAQQTLQELTLEVENDCPVARTFLSETEEVLIGEGIVWTCTTDATLKFKVKGEKHSSSKVKTLAAIDVEKVASIDEFVEYAVTINRLEQGLTKLQEKGLEQDSKNTGEFIKWIMQDIIKEELDTLVDSGLTLKDVQGKICNKARQFYLNTI